MNAGEGTWRERARALEDSLPREQRKRHGVWFTPIELAGPTAARALAPLDQDRPLRVCDPAAGAGTFLLAAAASLSGSGHRLIGIDRDGDGLALARRALAPFDRFHAELSVGDGLFEPEPGSCDCVLTNPPWETMQAGPDAAARVATLRPRFHHQGRGKLYTYRLFVERAVQLLRDGGRLGLVVPASLWFDRDAEPLRQLLLDTCRWQWLYGFENRERLFEIDSRYRFGIVIATKGGRTDRVCVAFGRTSVADWTADRPAHVRYGRRELQQLSPHSGAFVEVEHRRDLDVLARMQADAQPLLGDGGRFRWRQGDFNMTSDKHHFVLRSDAERDGYRHVGGALWQRPGAPDRIALLQGAMFYDLLGNAGAHDDGTGHRTRWRAPQYDDELRPLYLVDADAWREDRDRRAPFRVGLRALSNATNERTAIACLLPDVPCGNSVGVLTPRVDDASERPLLALAAGAAVLASLPFDWSLRMRLGGTNLNRFVLTDCILPTLDEARTLRLARSALRLCATPSWFGSLWTAAEREGWRGDCAPARDPAERRRLQTEIDTIVGEAFGLRADDVRWLTRGQPFAKGFWRIERDLDEAERRPARWLRAVTGR